MLTAIVLTYNEEKNIQKCLEPLSFCDHIFVVDSDSTDQTVKIAKKFGAKVLTHPLNSDWSAQRNWALAQIKSPWVLFVDADEIISKNLGQEIRVAIEKVDFKGYLIPRSDYMWKRKLRYGDVGGIKLLRLARRGAGFWQGKVHEKWIMEGHIGILKNSISHYPHQNMVEFLQHLNYYSTIRAQEFYDQGRKTNILEITVGPIWRFFQNYIIKLGFLDGTAGFIHAMSMAFYMFLVSGKLWLLYKGIA